MSLQQRINLQDFDVSLLQSQRIVENRLPRSDIDKNKIIISTEIQQQQPQRLQSFGKTNNLMTSNSSSNTFEIKFIVDSPFGSIQISNSIFISPTSITIAPANPTGHSESSLAEIYFTTPTATPTAGRLDMNQSDTMQSAKKSPAYPQEQKNLNKNSKQNQLHSYAKSHNASNLNRFRKASRAESISSATLPTAPSSLNVIDQDEDELNQFLTSFASSSSQSSSSSVNQTYAQLSAQTTSSISCFTDEDEIQQSQLPIFPKQDKPIQTATSTSTEEQLEDEEANCCFNANMQQNQQQLHNDTLMRVEQEIDDDAQEEDECGDSDQSLEGLSEISREFMRCEKKNSVKNVLKAFGNYLHALTDSDDADLLIRAGFKSAIDLRKRYSRYNKNQSYNNSLVSKIITHPQYGLLFSVFVNSVAAAWLHNSDVADKQSHSIFIEFCKHACINHSHLNCLKIIKKKHLKLSTS